MEEEELEKWFTQPVTDFAPFVEYEFEERDFQLLKSVGHHEVPWSLKESSNKRMLLLVSKCRRHIELWTKK
ncbi:unnamed protein product [Microthlaspi erraticum]|uniref:Uncharacterized protein n=1 Tax=Microthlaspi erraticum TaxID=1685480 RepID=A0A6D2I6T3_9BRAS|nr:unnamed protein product [Microthlaspi erraticum]